MDKLIVHGGRRLRGELAVHGAKNSVLALIAASVLTEEEVVLHRCPKIYDVFNMLKILEELGAGVRWEGDTAVISPGGMNKCEIPARLSHELRSSIFLLGPVVARAKRGSFAYPGGCDIGTRPIDLHIEGLRQLGVIVDDADGVLHCDGRNLAGGRVTLRVPSVGATENLIMAASLAAGETEIHNAAREPEIVDLQDLVNSMGGKVSGAGTPCVRVTGVTHLHGAEFTPIPDRIVAGTYLIAAAASGGEVLLNRCAPAHISALIEKLAESACQLKCFRDKIYLKAPAKLSAVREIITSPYPGFPTDLQAQMTALAALSEGVTAIREDLFETRFWHVGELVKMGAKIEVSGRTAYVTGVPKLTGTAVAAHDLRGGAALVIAGLAAEGDTEISGVRLIDRGYEDMAEQLVGCGADIVRISR